MDTKDEILDFLKQNRKLLKDRFHITKIGLFGSFARDEQNEESDVDIIIDIESDIKNIYDLKHSLKGYLSNAFGRKVDIAREKYITSYAKKYITKDILYV